MDKVHRVRISPEPDWRRVDKSVDAGSKGDFGGREVRQGSVDASSVHAASIQHERETQPPHIHKITQRKVGQDRASGKQHGALTSKKKCPRQKPTALTRRSLEKLEEEVQRQIDEAKKSDGFYELSPPDDLKTLTDPVKALLDQLIKSRPEIKAVLGLVMEHGLKISAEAGSGKSVSLQLHVGTMLYPIFPAEGAPAQIESLTRLLKGYPGGHIIFGWCVGNQLQRKDAYLCNALNSHQDIIDASRGDAELTVHTAGYQSRWNTDIIRRHFEGFPSRYSTQAPPSGTREGGQPTKKAGKRHVFGPTSDKLYDEESKRYRDSLAYKEQTVAPRRSSTKQVSGGERSIRPEETTPPSGTGESPTQLALASPPESPVRSKQSPDSGPSRKWEFDALVYKGGGEALTSGVTEAKREHIAKATEEMRDITSTLRRDDSKSSIKFRDLLRQRLGRSENM